MTREREIELCIKDLKDDININAKKITDSYAKDSEKTKSINYWVERLESSISDIKKYVEEYNSI